MTLAEEAALKLAFDELVTREASARVLLLAGLALLTGMEEDPLAAVDQIRGVAERLTGKVAGGLAQRTRDHVERDLTRLETAALQLARLRGDKQV